MRTRLRVRLCTRRFLRPLFSERHRFRQSSGNECRENAEARLEQGLVIARSECDEAIQRKMQNKDWIASLSLAMTAKWLFDR